MIPQRSERLLQIAPARRGVDEERGARVAAQRVFEEERQLRIAEGNV